MATSYTADDLLEQVRRGGSLPAAASTGTADADLLAHADAELRDTLVPLMLGVQEEYYQRQFLVSIISGVGGYRINKRAALSRLNTVEWLNADNSGYPLDRIDPKRALQVGVSTTSSGQPRYYYLEGGRLVMWPTPNAAGTVRIRAFVRPARLTLTTDTTNVKPITAVTVGATETEVTIVAHGISVSAIRDVVASTPSFEHLALDATATVEDVDTLSFLNTSLTTSPIVGDYVCVSDYTPYVQLPVELQPALVELVITRVLRARGKLTEANNHATEAERLVGIGIAGITPRVDTADRKITGGPHWRKSRNPIFWRGP